MLEVCSSYIGADGSVQELSQHKKNDIVNNVIKNSFAKKALRTLLIAYKDISEQEFETLKAQNNNFESEKDKEVLE